MSLDPSAGKFVKFLETKFCQNCLITLFHVVYGVKDSKTLN